MTELELVVEALKLCVDPVVFAKALETVTESNRFAPRKYNAQARARVAAALTGFGMPTHLKGFDYTVAAILLMIEHPMMIDEGFTKAIYPEVGRIYGVTWCCVERSIRRTVEVTFESGNSENLAAVFGNDLIAVRTEMTSSKFLQTVKRHIMSQDTNPGK